MKTYVILLTVFHAKTGNKCHMVLWSKDCEMLEAVEKLTELEQKHKGELLIFEPANGRY